MRESLYDFCKRTGQEQLLTQWALEKNLPLFPKQVSYGSKKKVWWRCEKGHEWQAAIHTRTTSHTSCPACARKVPIPGENDLATQFPSLAQEWHPTKNEALTPDQVLPGSHKSVWWICEHGHEWAAQIKSRTAGSGCPICANRQVIPTKNDLASRFPQIAAQWHPTKNGNLSPEFLAPGARRKVWWLCEKGHEWQATVTSRTSSGSSCPVCTGKKVVPGENDLASLFPRIAAQWHPTKNGHLSPQQVTASSNRKVWWLCEQGHSYQAVISARTISQSGCPYCANRKVLKGFNDLATIAPQVAQQWHPTLNGRLTPEMVTAGSHRKVWWLCDSGHTWKAAIYPRTGPQKCGCPVCAGHINKKQSKQH